MGQPLGFGVPERGDRTHLEAEDNGDLHAIRRSDRQWGMLASLTDYILSGGVPVNTHNDGDHHVLVKNLQDDDITNNSNWVTLAYYLEGLLGFARASKYYRYVADGNTSSFSGAGTVWRVTKNGVKQVIGTHFTLDGTTVEFTAPPAADDEIYIYFTQQAGATANRASAEGIEFVDVVTTDEDIFLKFDYKAQRIFNFLTALATPKTISVDAATDGNALVMAGHYEVTDVAAVLTWPADFTMQGTDNGRWDSVAKTWTPAAIGIYEFTATWDDINEIWKLKISDPFA